MLEPVSVPDVGDVTADLQARERKVNGARAYVWVARFAVNRVSKGDYEGAGPHEALEKALAAKIAEAKEFHEGLMAFAAKPPGGREEDT